MKDYLLTLVIVLTTGADVLAQAAYFTYAGNSPALDNGAVRRVIRLTGESMYTGGLRLAGAEPALTSPSRRLNRLPAPGSYFHPPD